MVAEEGFEPSQCESESQVLPLHNSALHSRRIAEVLYYYTKKFARCQHLFLRKSTRNKIPLRKICRVPGLIPKEKERIAKTIGGVVSTELLDNDTINKTLLSDGIISGITGLVEKLFNKMKLSEKTVREELYQKLDKDLVDNMTEKAEEDIAALIQDRKSTRLNSSHIEESRMPSSA